MIGADSSRRTIRRRCNAAAVPSVLPWPRPIALVGRVEWRDRQGRLHREGAPAVEHSNGTMEWWLHGERHRLDGPALESSNGSMSWYRKGKLHREDGPAVVRPFGKDSWWIDGWRLTEEEFDYLSRAARASRQATAATLNA